MNIATQWQDFELLDCSDGEKLERWGDVRLIRPDPQVIWRTPKSPLWESADARYLRSPAGGGGWEYRRKLPDEWQITYGALRFAVRPTGFKHTGLFPEQAVNWDWMRGIVQKTRGNFRALNLFGYTGGATLALLKEGAQVVHVDAAKGMIHWGRENAAFSGLSDKPCRWIVDDCMKFVQREIRRGNAYQGILMDPPSYGRGPGGEVWKLEDEIAPLLRETAKLLADDAAFFLLNAYTTGLQPTVLRNLLDFFVARQRGGRVSADELVLPVTAGGCLPCGASGRWERG